MGCNKQKFQNQDINFAFTVDQALKEDIGRGDITTELTIPKNKSIKGVLTARENCLVCGLGVAKLAFQKIDKNIRFRPLVSDGQSMKKGEVLARIQGKAASILIAERVALNFLGLLSAIATKTRKYVNAVKPYKVKIMDTRKTIPGLRELEKYAVRAGGGYNHRMRLDEMVLIKDNHIKVTSVENTVKMIRAKIPGAMKIEIEVENLKEYQEALKGKPDIIMLDNMKIAEIRKAVSIKRNMPQPIRSILLEASGGITLKNVRKVASCGVDMISIGDLTDSFDSIDISLEFL